MKRPAVQNKQVVVVRMAFQARKVLGTFEKRAPGQKIRLEIQFHKPNKFVNALIQSDIHLQVTANEGIRKTVK